jgi:hypothetical protein
VLALVACKTPSGPERIPVAQIKIVSAAKLRTSPVGGRMSANEVALWKQELGRDQPFFAGDDEAVDASYVLVDAENRSERDAFVTVDGTLVGAGKTGKLRPESLYVPAGDRRTFLLLDDKLAPEPWAQSVDVVVKGAMVAKFAPAMTITDVNVFTEDDHVVAAANVTATAKRPGEGIIHCAFHDADGDPLSRGHAVLVLEPGKTSVVRFKGPPGSKTATIFAGDEVY